MLKTSMVFKCFSEEKIFYVVCVPALLIVDWQKRHVFLFFGDVDVYKTYLSVVVANDTITWQCTSRTNIQTLKGNYGIWK